MDVNKILATNKSLLEKNAALESQLRAAKLKASTMEAAAIHFESQLNQALQAFEKLRTSVRLLLPLASEAERLNFTIGADILESDHLIAEIKRK